MEHESTMRLTVFFGIFLCMMVLEALISKKKLRFGRSRWSANLGLVVLNTVLVRVLFPVGAVGAALWAQHHHVGLLPMLQLDDIWTVLLAVVILDGVIYGQHLLFHRVPWLWRLHQVHHADRDIDVTTGLRFHPIEIILSMLIKISVVVLLGAPVLAVILFEMILNGMAMFNHANVKLPKALDAFLRLVFITPDVHRIHHSVLVHETNSNYGFNFSWWDRCFKTYRAQPDMGHNAMTIGLPEYQQQPTHDLLWMLRLPFRKRKSKHEGI
ncbi:MAG: sterol desaturase family protein [Zetaproteobacteria bacterium]|nr:sterol desaturase family protein [Zetaproteobacteria bacterium]